MYGGPLTETTYKEDTLTGTLDVRGHSKLAPGIRGHSDGTPVREHCDGDNL